MTEEVVYIITDEEKEAFVHLNTDEARDKFIEHFWEIRNPTPGSPTNSYKDEIYRRIAYANQWYGHRNGLEGWRSDRGRVYITLGAPQQTGKYLGFANIRPMEIWFYSNDNPALPPFFYVVFYQREVGDEMRLYSPFMDGPEKLVSAAMHENDRLGSWQIIDHDAGREVSRTVLSLLPSEPVDMQTATSSMASDMLLNNIRNLANHPLNKDMLRERSNLLETVSHRVVLHGDYLDVLTVGLVDPDGETNLHYVVRMKRPDDFSLAEDENKRYFYSATVRAVVSTSEGKQIFTQERKLSSFVDDRQFVRIRNGVFGYEGLLPLPPGKYKIQFQLTDEVKHTSFPAEREVVVPSRPSEGMRITEVVPFSEATTTASSLFPFTAAGVRFTPSSPDLTLIPGQDLEFFYQIWAASPDVSASFEDLQVEYGYGRMGMHDTKSVKESLARNQFDSHGAMINGKRISTADLAPGTYRMAITVTDPTTHTRTVASFQFHIAESNPSPLIWDVSDPEASEDYQKGRREYQRALCYVMQGQGQNAVGYLKSSYTKDPAEDTRDRLVDLLYSRQAFKEVAELYTKGGVTADTSEETVLAMAESLRHLGEVDKSIKVLESELPFRKSSALYLGLARYYQLSGDSQKASDMEQKAKELSSAQPPAS
ncbi:MAG TPA: GWxTD domain-containing protein [Terriglobales bacterium]|nr:GWxTD domain-containing protein [Terriglobales bacterium]